MGNNMRYDEAETLRATQLESLRKLLTGIAEGDSKKNDDICGVMSGNWNSPPNTYHCINISCAECMFNGAKAADKMIETIDIILPQVKVIDLIGGK